MPANINTVARLADRNGAACGANRVHAAAEHSTQHAAAIHWIRRQQIESREPEIGPDQASRQIAGIKIRPDPQLEPRGHQKNHAGRCHCNHQIHQGPSQGNANVPFPRQSSRFQRLLRFIQQGDSANRQQDDRFSADTGMSAHQRVAQLMQNHATEDNPDQRQATGCAGVPMRCRLREPHKKQ